MWNIQFGSFCLTVSSFDFYQRHYAYGQLNQSAKELNHAFYIANRLENNLNTTHKKRKKGGMKIGKKNHEMEIMKQGAHIVSVAVKIN